jgi:hypothetical protein
MLKWLRVRISLHGALATMTLVELGVSLRGCHRGLSRDKRLVLLKTSVPHFSVTCAAARQHSVNALLWFALQSERKVL